MAQKPKNMSPEYQRQKRQGMRAVCIAACEFLKARDGSQNKQEALDRLKNAMAKHGPYPGKPGLPKGTPQKRRHVESKEIKLARKRIESDKKLRLIQPKSGAKKGKEWVELREKAIAKRKAEEQVRAELAVLQQKLQEL